MVVQRDDRGHRGLPARAAGPTAEEAGVNMPTFVGCLAGCAGGLIALLIAVTWVIFSGEASGPGGRTLR